MTFSTAAWRTCTLAGFAFLAVMQYVIWRETAHTVQPGHRYIDPLVPSVLAAAMVTAVVILTAAIAAGIAAVRRRWHSRRLRRALAAARAAESRQPARTLPAVVSAHPAAPARVIWRPDDGIFDVTDIEPVCRMAFDHDAAFVIVDMKPAAEQAARILIRDFWPRLCAEEGDDRACPVVLAIARGGILAPNRRLLIGEDGPPPLVIPTRTTPAKAPR